MKLRFKHEWDLLEDGTGRAVKVLLYTDEGGRWWYSVPAREGGIRGPFMNSGKALSKARMQAGVSG